MSIFKLLHSSKKLMLVIQCRRSFNFCLVAREIFDLTAYVAPTLNKLRPLLIYKIYLQNLEEISSLSASLPYFVHPNITLAPSVVSLQNTKGQLVLCYFFPNFYQPLLVLPKNDSNTEDKMQSNSTFVLFGIHQTLYSFPVTTSNHRFPVIVLGFRNILKPRNYYMSTTSN